MKKFIIRWVGYTLAVMLVANFVDGFSVAGFWSAFVVAIVLGLINTFIKPIIMLISLPINMMTLGLFSLVINALMIMLASYFLTPDFAVDGFVSAFFGAIILAVANWFVDFITGK